MQPARKKTNATQHWNQQCHALLMLKQLAPSAIPKRCGWSLQAKNAAATANAALIAAPAAAADDPAP